jgi:broad specificity polyphosphatase/5'/3'-nucleotidase SurE
MQISSRDYEQINSYTDTVLENLHEQMVEQGLNNINLPDTRTNFSKRRLGVTWQGEAVLSDGILKGLETIHRTGDAVITINVSLCY